MVGVCVQPQALLPAVGSCQACWQEPQHHIHFAEERNRAPEQWRAQGGACRKEHLLDGCEDGRRVMGDDALRSHMRNLRHKLSAAGGHANLIETVYGLGYRLAAP